MNGAVSCDISIEMPSKSVEKRWRDVEGVCKARKSQDMRKHELKWVFCWRKKKHFGSNDLKFIGSRRGIRIPVSFMQWRIQKRGATTSWL